MFGRFRHYFRAFKRIATTVEGASQFQARREALRQENQVGPSRLGKFEYKVCSQNGEDGIISEIFNRIGETNRRFVEIGVHFAENNTLHLLNQGWSGLWVDMELEPGRFPEPLRAVADSGRLRVECSRLKPEDLPRLLDALEPGGEIDLLSIDVDYHTHALWEAESASRARVVVVEYNALLGPDRALRVKPDPDREWDGSLYFGASLKSLEQLGRRRGYSLVGCDLSGVNAFFVRNDCLSGRFDEPHSSEFHFQPMRRWMSPKRDYRVGFGDFLND